MSYIPLVITLALLSESDPGRRVDYESEASTPSTLHRDIDLRNLATLQEGRYSRSVSDLVDCMKRYSDFRIFNKV